MEENEVVTKDVAEDCPKKIISQAEFDKRVEMEYESLKYFEYLKSEEAWPKAEQAILSDYQTG